MINIGKPEVDLDCLHIVYESNLVDDKKCPINERKCKYCNSNDVEDEYHFVLVCDFYTELRKLYIKKFFYVRPSMAKFIDLLNSDSIFMLKKNWVNMCTNLLIRGTTLPSDVNKRKLSLYITTALLVFLIFFHPLYTFYIYLYNLSPTCTHNYCKVLLNCMLWQCM